MTKFTSILYIAVHWYVSNIFWKLVWEWGIGGDKWMNKSTNIWVKSHCMIVNAMAEWIYYSSGWHGMNIVLKNGRKGIIQVNVNDH